MARITTRPNSIRRRVRFINRLICMLLVSAAWTRLFVRPRVEGRENLKHDGPLIIAANHRSPFDIPAMAGIVLRCRRDVTFLAMAELFRNPITRAVLRWFGIIPVHRGSKRAAESTEEGIVVLKAGGCVIVYIEGQISRTEALLPPRNGVAHMALEIGATVIPVAVAGTDNVKHLGTPPWKWGWRKPYGVVIGEGIPIGCMPNATPAARTEVTGQVMEQITTQYERAKQLAA